MHLFPFQFVGIGRFACLVLVPYRYHAQHLLRAVHVEYAYRFGNHRDCIDLNTLEDTWYVFPENCLFSVTKISLATEEIFNEIWRQRNEKRQKEISL